MTSDLLRLAIPEARAAFPNSPLFFAVQEQDRAYVLDILPQLTPIAHQGDSTIYAIP
jgi:hypothetical protein